MNIPLKPNNKKTNIEELDDLNLEFWRHQVMKNGVYTPKKYLSKYIFKNNNNIIQKKKENFIF